MRSLQRLFLLLIIFSGISSRLYASHLMGGEITWTCQGSGQYIFQMKLYRDCNGVQGPATVTLDVFNNPSLLAIPLNLVSQIDISPQCNVIGPSITCANAQSQVGWPNSPTPVGAHNAQWSSPRSRMDFFVFFLLPQYCDYEYQ